MVPDKSQIVIRNPKSFAIVDNIVLRNKSVTLQAKGLYALLCGYSDQSTLSFDYLMKQSINGRDALRNAFKELENIGAVRRYQTNGKNGKFATVIELLPLADKPEQANLPLTEKPEAVNRRRSAASGEPLSGEPPPVNPPQRNIYRETRSKERDIKNNTLSDSLTDQADRSGVPPELNRAEQSPALPKHNGGEPPRNNRAEQSPAPLNDSDGLSPVVASKKKKMSYFEFVAYLRSHSRINGAPVEFTLSDSQSVYISNDGKMCDWVSNSALSPKDAETAFKSLFKRRDILVPALIANFAKYEAKNAK